MRCDNSLEADCVNISGGVCRAQGSFETAHSVIRRVRMVLYTPAFIFVMMAALSLPLRLVNLGAPFSGEHEFRQTQTALSVWEIREHGFSLLHPRLPLFGPPWECPFEYPVFQTIAAAIDSIAPWSNLDISIRVTNLLFFYLTAIMLALLAWLILQESEVALFTAAVFLFSGYNVFWSRTSMIEYAATFFGLAYLVCFLRWTLRPRRILFILTLGLGILGCLTKATSFVIPLITTTTLGSLRFLEFARRPHQFNEQAKSMAKAGGSSHEQFQGAPFFLHILGLAALVVVPLTVGYLYIRYGDAIKEQGIYTAWLSSNHPYTKTWTYGTWDQRCHLRNWRMLWNGAQHAILPSLSFAMVIGFCALPFRTRLFGRSPGANFWVGGSLALAPAFAVFVFYNLYVVHSYYLIACAPLLALFAGVGLSLVFKLVRTKLIRVVFLLLLIGLGLREWSGRLGEMLSGAKTVDSRMGYLSEVAQFIKQDEPVIILSSAEWSGFAPYYLKRRAFMAMLINKPVNIQPLLDQEYFKKNGFRWLLMEGDQSGMLALANRIKERWKTARAMPLSGVHNPYLLYSLSDE